MNENMDFTDLVDEHFHVDGPKDADQIVMALRSAARLMRFVNHATLPGTRHLQYGPQVYRAIGAFKETISLAGQAAQQLGHAAEALADDPTMYDDRRTAAFPARTTALTVSVIMTDEVPGPLADVVRDLNEAHAHACHLGHDL